MVKLLSDISTCPDIACKQLALHRHPVLALEATNGSFAAVESVQRSLQLVLEHLRVRAAVRGLIASDLALGAVAEVATLNLRC